MHLLANAKKARLYGGQGVHAVCGRNYDACKRERTNCVCVCVSKECEYRNTYDTPVCVRGAWHYIFTVLHSTRPTKRPRGPCQGLQPLQCKATQGSTLYWCALCQASQQGRNRGQLVLLWGTLCGLWAELTVPRCTTTARSQRRTKGHLYVYEDHVGMEGMCGLLVCHDKGPQGQQDGRLILDAFVDVGEHFQHLNLTGDGRRVDWGK